MRVEAGGNAWAHVGGTPLAELRAGSRDPPELALSEVEGTAALPANCGLADSILTWPNQLPAHFEKAHFIQAKYFKEKVK
jgi:hypothetical protein